MTIIVKEIKHFRRNVWRGIKYENENKWRDCIPARADARYSGLTLWNILIFMI